MRQDSKLVEVEPGHALILGLCVSDLLILIVQHDSAGFLSLFWNTIFSHVGHVEGQGM